MTLNDTYINYFKHQAVNHPALLHQESSKVFEVIGVEEAVGDFRSNVKEKGFILRLIMYTYNVGDGGAHETSKHVTGGFIVAKYYSNRRGGRGDYFEAMKDSECVMDELIEKIISDSRNGHPLFNYSINSRQDFIVQPKTGAGETGYVGWLCTFQFSNYFRVCLTDIYAPSWLDGGKTPFFFNILPCEITIQGTYNDITAAETGGATTGDFFLLTTDNLYGMPPVVMQFEPTQTFSNDEDAISTLGYDSCYAVSEDNVYGLPAWTIRVTPKKIKVFLDDEDALSAGLSEGDLYTWFADDVGGSNLIKKIGS